MNMTELCIDFNNKQGRENEKVNEMADDLIRIVSLFKTKEDMLQTIAQYCAYKTGMVS